MLSYVAQATPPKPSISPGRLVLYLLTGLYFVAGLGYLALRWWVWPNLDHWRPALVAQITELTGRPMTIGSIAPGFSGLSPMLVLDEVTLQDTHGAPALRLPRVEAVLSLRSLLVGEPRLALLAVHAPELTAERLADGRIRVAGVDLDPSAPGDDGGLQRLLGQRRIVVRDARVQWFDRIDGTAQRFEGIAITFGNIGRRHRAAIEIAEAGALGRKLALVAEFYRPPRSQAGDWTSWQGEAYAAGDAVDLDRIARIARLRLPVEGARGSFRAWTRFDAGHLDDMLLKTEFADLRWRGAEGTTVRVAGARVQVGARRARAGGHNLRIDEFDLRADTVRDGARDASPGLALRTRGEQNLWLDDEGLPRSGRLSLESFDLPAAQAIARALPLPDAGAHALRNLTTRGEITRLDLSFNRALSLSFDADVEFDRLSLIQAPGAGPAPAPSPALSPAAPARPAAAPVPTGAGAAGAAHATNDEAPPRPGIPSIEGVSGSARIREDQGELSLEGRAAALSFPGVFEQPRLPLDLLQAQLRWQVGASPEQPALKVTLEAMRFESADAAGTVSGSYATGGRGPGIVDIAGVLERGQAGRAWRYLPLSIPQRVRDWLQHAVTTGQASDAHFRLRGDLWDFPYRDPANGDFAIEAKVSDATLAYSPDWPPIENFQGTVRFERAGMDIAMRTGTTYGVALSDTRARIVDFRDPLLTIEGTGQGPAQDMVRFVNESPVSTRIDDFTRDTHAEGPARLQLKLDLPLADLSQTRVAGSVQFAGNALRLDATIPPFSDVTGRLEFGDKGLALRNIQAGFLGGTLKVDGDTPEPGRFDLRAQGRISAENMRAVVDNPLTRKLSGATDYRALLDVRRRAATITIESDLVGLASALPAPFDKPAEAAWPLRVVSAPVTPAAADERAQRDTIRLSLRDDIRLALERVRDAASQRLKIQRGAFAIDGEPLMPDNGFAVSVRAREVDFDQWGALLSGGGLRAAHEQAGEQFAEGFTLLPSQVSVLADRLRVGGKDLHGVVFGATRVGGFWRANIRAREVDGFFNWRDAAPGQRIGTLTARFSRLEIPPSRRSEIESMLESAPDELPALDVAAGELVLGEQKMGSLTLQASNGGTAEQPVWNLNALRIEHPAAVFSASGVWAPARAGAPRTTRLDYELALQDSGALLDDFGIRHAVRGGAGSLEGRLTWNGSPMAIDYGSLGGHMKVDVGRGQFLKTDPGIAKLISVVNLQSLPRRLTLDFRDVFAEGFAFDQLKGDLTIAQGVARTDALTMRGVQALVRIRGEADIARETQALDVEVRPELNAGLASLAYAAMVNPAVGLGSFLAQLVLRKPLEEMFTYEYLVKGSWTDPLVTEKRRPHLPAPAFAP